MEFRLPNKHEKRWAYIFKLTFLQSVSILSSFDHVHFIATF